MKKSIKNNKPWKLASKCVTSVYPPTIQSKYVFDGVKPKCVGQIWTDITYSRLRRSIIIKTLHHIRDSKREVWMLSHESWKVEEIPLPASFDERVVGKPCCIARSGFIIVAQYVTANCKYLRFMLIDLQNQVIQLFEDCEHYFHKNFASVWPVECLVSPCWKWLLFRLPQIIMSDRKWSKTLQSSVKRTECNCQVNYKVDGLSASHIQDRRNQAIIFDVRYKNRLILAELDQFCSKCKLTVYHNGILSGEVKELKFNFSTCSKETTVCRGIDQEYSHSGMNLNVDYFLQHCNLSTSHDGSCFLLTFSGVQKNFYAPGDRYPSENVIMSVVIIDADSLEILESRMEYMDNVQPVPPCEPPACQSLKALDSVDAIYVPIYDRSDSQATIWQLVKGYPPRQTDFVINLPRKCSLKALCRQVICQSTENINFLPLPKSLLAYLHFDHKLIEDAREE